MRSANPHGWFVAISLNGAFPGSDRGTLRPGQRYFVLSVAFRSSNCSREANSFPWTESRTCTTIRRLTSLKTFPSRCNGDQAFAARNAADFEAEAERSAERLRIRHPEVNLHHARYQPWGISREFDLE